MQKVVDGNRLVARGKKTKRMHFLRSHKIVSKCFNENETILHARMLQ